MGWKFQPRQGYSVRFNTVLQRNVLGLLLLNSVSCVHGNPKTICFNWDLVLQFLSPGHFKFFILAEILSLELDTWQSALPTKFQLNSFTFDCNAFLCTRMKDQTRFFILFIFSSPGPWPQFNVPLRKIPLIIFITQFFEIILNKILESKIEQVLFNKTKCDPGLSCGIFSELHNPFDCEIVLFLWNLLVLQWK